MSMRTFTADQLCLSPFNVRQNQEDANATDALEASIAAHGLLFPLVVHPIHTRPRANRTAEKAVTHGVLAGGRRFRAIVRLIEAGTLPIDFAIETVVRDVPPAEITELSLAENILRRDLQPYEISAAIAKAAEQGATIEEIASRCGQRIRLVRQQLRLGNLQPEIFAAYAAGTISFGLATAYGATADHDLQLAAWRHFAARASYEHSERNVRAWLKVGDAEMARLLRFVGGDAYREAGGRFELDLFAEHSGDSGRVADEGLLREMVERRLGEARDAIRLACGRPGLRFAAEAPRPGGVPDTALEFMPEEAGAGADRRVDLPDSEEIVCTLVVANGGQLEERWWWNSRKAKAAVSKAPAAASHAMAKGAAPLGSRDSLDDGGAIGRWGYEQNKTARAVLRSDHGLTSDGMQILRSIRREVLRAMLVRNARHGGTVGRDYIVWAQLRQLLRTETPASTGAYGLGAGLYTETGDREPKETSDFLREVPAHREWNEAVEQIKAMPFITLDDAFEAFDSFAYAGPDIHCLAGAVLAGFALVRSLNADGYRCRAHDCAAELADVDDGEIRDLWEPTAEFMGLFPKGTRLEIARPFVGKTVFPSWEKLDSATLSGAVAGALQPDAHKDPAMRDRAAKWVHPLLAFPLDKPGTLASVLAEAQSDV